MKHISNRSWNKTTRKASNVLTFSFDCTNAYLWFYRLSPLLLLNHFFAFTEMSSPQRNYSEPSPSQRRALAVSITSLRQLVEYKGEVQLIPTYVSDNPLKRFTKSMPFVLISLFDFVEFKGSPLQGEFITLNWTDESWKIILRLSSFHSHSLLELLLWFGWRFVVLIF